MQQARIVMSSDAKQQVEDRLQASLRQSFQSLQNDENSTEEKVTEKQILGWARLICNSMTTPARLYHNAEHVMEVLDNLNSEVSADDPVAQPDPISNLAVLFHDIIYYSLDKKLSPEQNHLLKDVIREDETNGQIKVSLVPFTIHQDPIAAMVKAIFDMPENEPLPNLGTNEFLSALMAVRTLSHVLSKRQLLQLAVGIEATVPFRSVDGTTGKSAMDRLYDRSLKIYSHFVSSGSDPARGEEGDSFVSHAVQQAVIVANSDLGAFSSPDPTTFIDSNCRLLPEWFPILLTSEQCSLSDYQQALTSVRQRPMDPSIIFLSFRGIPDASALAEKRQRARTNLSVLRNYIGIRVLTMTMLIELAGYADNDTTLQLTDLSSIEQVAIKKGVLNTQTSVGWKAPQDSLIFSVLKTGRRVDYSWDAKQSPLAAALFAELGGSEEVSRQLEQREALGGNGMNWLKSLPKNVVSAAVQGLMEPRPDLGKYKAKLLDQLDRSS